MSKILGIDFGTTNSCMAVWKKKEIIIIPNAEGVRVTPSIVAFTKNGDILVGESAKRQAVTNPKNTISFVKRLLGREFNEIEDSLKKMPYEVAAGKNGAVNIVISNKNYLPQQIAAFILKKLKTDAELYLGEEIKQAVITVPAYFNDNQRQATYDAGQIAGMDVLAILNEPSSAALAYCLDQNSQGFWGVFDFGGGTLDLSILKINNNEFEVLATKGNTSLGGFDFDNLIIDYLADKFQKAYNVDLRSDAQALQRLTDAAEKAKCELSSIRTAEINLPFISATDSGPLHLNENLTRLEFERMTADLIEKSVSPLTETVADSQLQFDDLNEILLVGGMTRMPEVRRKVQNISHCKILQSIKPDEVIAYGAAIYGASSTGKIDDLVFLDVVPESLGIETTKGKVARLIEKNSSIPIRISDMFTTEFDNQTTVTVNILQGDGEFVTDNKSIGHFVLNGIDPAPKGSSHIEVTFDVDLNGIMNVSAVDLKTGVKKDLQITSALKLTKDEIKRMEKTIE